MSNMARKGDDAFRENSPRPPVPGGISKDDCTLGDKKPSVSAALLVRPGYVGRSYCCTSPVAEEDHDVERHMEPDGCPPEHSLQFLECPQNGVPAGACNEFSVLLEDATGVSYFRNFLNEQLHTDALEFWLAGTGFRKLESGKLRLVARSIFKKFVARNSDRLSLSADVRHQIRDRLKLDRIDNTLFDDAVVEAERVLRCVFFPEFVKSSDYVDYVQTRTSSTVTTPPKNGICDEVQLPCTAKCKQVCSTIVETDETKTSVDYTCISASNCQPSSSDCRSDQHSNYPKCRLYRDGGFADGSSSLTVNNIAQGPSSWAHDTTSSEPHTDDTFSLTDSSIDTHDRKGHSCCRWPGPVLERSIPRHATMAEKDPHRFALNLIERLNQLNVECEDSEPVVKTKSLSAATAVPVGTVSADRCSASSKMAAMSSVLLAASAAEKEENAQSILERHIMCVFDSPETQTPTDFHLSVCPQGPVLATSAGNCGKHGTETEFMHASDCTVGCPTSHRHKDGTPVPLACKRVSPPTRHWQPPASLSTSAHEKVNKWLLVNDDIQCDSPGRVASTKHTYKLSTADAKLCAGPPHRSGADHAASGIRPAQPISQDPLMPLLSPPDPTTQLEEARRRLQHDRALPKFMSFDVALSSNRDESTSFVTSGLGAPPAHALSSSKHVHRACASVMPGPDHLTRSYHCESRVSHQHSASVPVTPGQQHPDTSGIQVFYFLCEEPIPYSTRLPGPRVTLAQFKEVLAKKGNYRFYCKCECGDFGAGYVYEEILYDDMELPMVDGKICAKVVRRM